MPSPPSALASPIGSCVDRVREAFGSPNAGTVAIAAVFVVTVGTTLGIVALGAVFDATVDERITVDNPDRPPESTCETFGDEPDSLVAEECDEPARIEVDAGEELRDATTGSLHYGLFGVPLWCALFAVALHVGATVAGGTGSVGDAFVVAGWALAAELIRVAAGVAAVWYALSTATLSGGSVEALATDAVAAVGSATGPVFAASAVAVAVQWVVVVGGLEAEYDLDRGPAAGVATCFAAVALVIAVV
jgi:hypothetical protein